jgi:PAS domain-containing protein
MPESLTIATKLAQRFTEYRDRIDQISGQLRQYKVMIDLCPLPTIFCESHGHLVYANTAYLQMVLAADLSDVQQDLWLNVVHPEDLARVQACWKAFLTDPQQNRFEIEYRCVRNDDKMFTVLLKAQQILSSNIVGYIVPTMFSGFTQWLRGSDLSSMPGLHL